MGVEGYEVRVSTSPIVDDASFERVVNLPTRGIGARTLEVLRGVTLEVARGDFLALRGGYQGHVIPETDQRRDAVFRQFIRKRNDKTVFVFAGMTNNGGWKR